MEGETKLRASILPNFTAWGEARNGALRDAAVAPLWPPTGAPGRFQLRGSHLRGLLLPETSL